MKSKIDTLLQKEEGKQLEFKRDLSSSKNLIKTIVAFANSSGRTVVIGVEDGTKELVGIENILDEEERLGSIIADSISPRIVPNIEIVSIEEKCLLLVEVYLSGSRPHWITADGEDEGVYVRLGSSNRKADRQLIEEIRRTVQGTAYDELPVADGTIDDLDILAMRDVFGSADNLPDTQLETLKLMRPYQGRNVPSIWSDPSLRQDPKAALLRCLDTMWPVHRYQQGKNIRSYRYI
ncbi:MAG: putative DNA binding domain-containing protein [Spirochaetia bacterium]|nr:putative DNA binding domain-containing protein [Spirochaetia bacterium]